jgi:hypothetical protein
MGRAQRQPAHACRLLSSHACQSPAFADRMPPPPCPRVCHWPNPPAHPFSLRVAPFTGPPPPILFLRRLLKEISMLSSHLSSPHRSSSTIECNVSLSFPLASYPLPISEGPHRPRQISPQAPPSSTINGENSPPSSSPHSLARLTLSSLSSTHRSHRRPSELSKNHATIRTLVPTTAKPLLQPRHCRPSSPVRTRT